MAQRDLAAPAV